MSRRRSISLRGMPADDIARLRSDDDKFYGSDGGDDSSTDSDSSDAPPAKRMRRDTSDEGSDGDDSASDDGGEDDDDTAARAHVSAKLQDWIDIGCGCIQSNHFEKLPREELEELMFNLHQAKKRDKKLYIMGQLAGTMHIARTDTSRKHTFSYHVLGCEVCRTVFMDVHWISKRVLRTLQELVECNQVVPPAHKSTGRKRKHAVPEDVKEAAALFIRNYANTHGMPQPAAPRGHRGQPPTYLPATLTILSVYNIFHEANPAMHHVSYETFRRV